MATSAGKSRKIKTPAGTAARTPSIVQTARRLGRLIPAEELRLIPKDLSSRIDHYVYGAPKR
jgi:hypothetical protein